MMMKIFVKNFAKGASSPALQEEKTIKRTSVNKNSEKRGIVVKDGRLKGASIGSIIIVELTDLWKRKLQLIRDSAI